MAEPAKSSPLSELRIALPSLPLRLQEVGRFVAANDYDATTRSMRDLAAEAGADPAAFTRLAKAIGYSGWDELRAALTEARRPSQTSPFSGRAKGRRHGPNADVTLITDKLEAEAAGLPRISAHAIADAARTLHDAKRIWITGYRSCRSVAELLNYELRLFRPEQVQIVGGSGPDDLDLGAFRPGEAVIVIGFLPYTQCQRPRRASRLSRWRNADRDRGQRRSADGRGRRPRAAVRGGLFARLLPEPHRRARDRAVARRGDVLARRRRRKEAAAGYRGAARRGLHLRLGERLTHEHPHQSRAASLAA